MVAYSCTHMYMYMNTVNTAAPESETACDFCNVYVEFEPVGVPLRRKCFRTNFSLIPTTTQLDLQGRGRERGREGEGSEGGGEREGGRGKGGSEGGGEREGGRGKGGREQGKRGGDGGRDGQIKL